jgi:hypothetical protein
MIIVQVFPVQKENKLNGDKNLQAAYLPLPSF